jgi:hypothetical protein
VLYRNRRGSQFDVTLQCMHVGDIISLADGAWSGVHSICMWEISSALPMERGLAYIVWRLKTCL